MRAGAASAGVLVLATALAACAGGTDLSAVAGVCTKAVDKAIGPAGDRLTGADFVRLGEHGDSLSVSSPISGEIGTNITGLAVGCIMKETQAPSWVEARLRGTDELDSPRTVTWGDLTMAYRFTANDGLSAVVRRS